MDKFVPYLNYTGDLATRGQVDVDGLVSSAGQSLTWDLSGVDPNCKDGPGEKPNSCGVHIHAGKSCKEDALGHFFKTTNDPWKTITYTAKQSSKGYWEAQDSKVKVATELTGAEVTGRTFIVHDFEGKRVACGIID